MDETHEIRLKRLQMRCWRRGMKEMDLILGRFADGPLAGLDAPMLAQFEDLISENDQDLYLWIAARTRGEAAGPEGFSGILQILAEFALNEVAAVR